MDGLEVGSINLLLLPLLGGYWFLYRFVGTHYRAERLTAQRLTFHAGLLALLFVAMSRLLIDAADSPWQPEDISVELLMFGAIPAFIALIFYGLALNAFYSSYFALAVEPSATVDFGAPPPVDSDVSPAFELARAAIGIAIAVILAIVAFYIGVALSNISTRVTISGFLLFLALLLIARCYHLYICRYLTISFHSIALRIGLFGVMASLGLAVFLFQSSCLHNLWDHLIHVKGSGLPVMACLMGLFTWWPLNILYPYQAANSRLHEHNGTTALDRLLYRASLAQHLLSISMKDGKVYIGYIQELPPNPEDRNSYFEILPVQSGYRDKDSREMKLTTFYGEAYEQLVQAKASAERWLVFLKVLKIDDIVSAGRFDPEAYVKFQGEKAPIGLDEGLENSSG